MSRIKIIQHLAAKKREDRKNRKEEKMKALEAMKQTVKRATTQLEIKLENLDPLEPKNRIVRACRFMGDYDDANCVISKIFFINYYSF